MNGNPVKQQRQCDLLVYTRFIIRRICNYYTYTITHKQHESVISVSAAREPFVMLEAVRANTWIYIYYSAWQETRDS
ncbi:Hypothetical predicted protein [Cloeon dipterum]|uniref:Uncharacterized protein n=1 Tax=Cloeon dipterum TaxID=197152 RepID=A0A8S1DT55_9INSE|nr:Hypothetical predicted protein [Cloeon dipterum]